MANYVQTLLNASDRLEKVIGEEVRLIAQQQNQSVSTTLEAMEKIQNRSKIKTFLLGTDYKNLGALRSEMVQTRNRIDQISRSLLISRDATDTAAIESQMMEMEKELEKMENFVREQEGKFSLFGWLLKLFQ